VTAGARPAAALVFGLLLLSSASPASPDPAAMPGDAATERLRERIEQLEATGRLSVDGSELAARKALPALYGENGYRRFWTPEKIDALSEILRDSAKDGLTPEDYHASAVARLAEALRGGADPGRLADADLLATDGFALLLLHLYNGKVDPRSLDPHWNFELRPIVERDAVKFVSDALTEGRLAEAVSRVRPSHWWYERARASLAEYRALAQRGGWPAVPPGPALKTGMTGARVVALRKRLAATHDVEQTVDDAAYDGPLADAVRAFQRRHRLEADGAVGAGTLAELNVPVEARIRQIRVNLERARWALHEITGSDLVLVDIAGFEVSYLRDQQALWTAKIQVGKPYRQTPVFKSAIDNVVFNPTWTVPPTIFTKDILPKLRTDPAGTLAAKKLEVLDRNGKPVDPSGVDWSRVTARNFPYMLRQAPGPDNALGRVKILFPNPHLVYLHDTPSKNLFEKGERAFSSGCIRVERPLELAERLLNDPRWDQAAIARAIEDGTTRTVRLARPVPVLLMYWTIVPSDDGHTVFKRDPYGRDAKVASALDKPFGSGDR